MMSLRLLNGYSGEHLIWTELIANSVFMNAVTIQMAQNEMCVLSAHRQAHDNISGP